MDEPRKRTRVIAFDFDGVIAEYKGFVSATDVKPPISSVVEAIKKLKEKGYKILIYSTRGDDFLKKYCADFSVPVDYINHNPEHTGENKGKPLAFVYVDDRTVRYEGQNTETLVSQIENFKPYWK